jgi:hypothetical protein
VWEGSPLEGIRKTTKPLQLFPGHWIVGAPWTFDKKKIAKLIKEEIYPNI